MSQVLPQGLEGVGVDSPALVNLTGMPRQVIGGRPHPGPAFSYFLITHQHLSRVEVTQSRITASPSAASKTPSERSERVHSYLCELKKAMKTLPSESGIDIQAEFVTPT